MNPVRKTKRVVPLLVASLLATGGAFGQSIRQLRGQPETMSFLAWIVLGLVAGFIGSKIVNRRGEGIILDVLLGVVGALAGGWLFHIFGVAGVNGLNLYSLFVAVVGSVVLLVLYHAIRGKGSWYGR